MHHNIRKSQSKKGNIRLLLEVLAVVLLIGAYGNGRTNNILLYAANIIIYGCVLTGSIIDDIYLYIFLAPFTGIVISPIFRLYYVLIISILKIILRKKSFSSLAFIGVFYAIVNILVFDILLNNEMSVMTLLGGFIYVICVIDSEIWHECDVQKCVWRMLFSCVLILLAMLAYSKSSLIDYAFSDRIQDRFGEETRELGGSMGVSLYGTMGIASCIYLLFADLQARYKIMQYVTILLLGVFILFLELFALSRTFFTVVIILLIISFFKMKNQKKWKLLISAFIFISVIVVSLILLIPNEGGLMVNKLKIYFGGIGEGGRWNIWSDSIVYVLSNITTFLFGGGISRYYTNTSVVGYSFYEAGAHNLVLDVILSWGVPLFCLIVIWLFGKISNKTKNKKSKNNKIIWIAWLLCMLAQGSLREMTSYFYFLAGVVITFNRSMSNEMGEYNESSETT